MTQNFGLERLCRVSLENLNSLAGSWSVNFEELAYSGGLFAILGPTGAGKSSLLDAICLGLYGATPRLGAITQGTNELMTHGAGSCKASVTFCAAGETWQAVWSQHRSGNHPSGALQPQRHRLGRVKRENGVDTVELVAEKINDVRAKITELLGMDFVQFTRSVLIPQGKWASFLSAPPSERAALLEKLTGAEKYSKISERVSESWKIDETLFAAKNAELDALNVPSCEDAQSLLAEVEELRSRRKISSEELQKVEKKRENAALWAAYERDSAALEADRKKFESDLSAFAADQLRLERHEAAEPLFLAQKELEKKRDAVLSLKNELAAREKELKEARLSLDEKRAAYSAQEAERQRALDELREERRQTREALSELEDRSALEGTLFQLSQLELEEKELSEAEKTAAQKIAGTNDEIKEAATEDERVRAALAQAEKGLEASCLSKLRSSLVEGLPCPLCGALHHQPIAGQPQDVQAGEEPVLSARNAVLKAGRRLARLEERLKTLENELGTIHRRQADWSERRRKFGEPDLLISALSRRVEAVISQHDALTEKMEKLSAKIDELQSGTNDAPKSDMRSMEERTNRLEGLIEGIKKTIAETDRTAEEALRERDAEKNKLERRGLPTSLSELRLSDGEAAALKETAGELSRRAASFEGRSGEVKKRAEGLPSRPAEDAEALAAECETLREKMGALDRELGQTEERLNAEKRLSEKRGLLQKEVQEMKGQLELLRELYGLVGSATKFRKFVQTLTFHFLLRQANVHLDELSGRYALVPDKNEPMDFAVMDRWQGGTVRSARSLSGGESFLVSLSLALALGRRRSGGVLFLDEGFGNLDEESLDGVLTALEALKGAGGLVGVISHVSALKDRISCRIQVSRSSGWSSVLSGPGVISEKVHP